ncbi:MAG: hypothetical protein WC866_04840 [Patescibacteria group bacterium]|jgi:hypothetical protein
MLEVKTDETITTIRVLASQGAINFDTDKLEGFEGVIADVFSAHGMGTRETLMEDSVLIDHAGEFVSGLAVIFPNLETITISRSMSSADGGGRYDWKTFQRKPQTSKSS